MSVPQVCEPSETCLVVFPKLDGAFLCAVTCRQSLLVAKRRDESDPIIITGEFAPARVGALAGVEAVVFEIGISTAAVRLSGRDPLRSGTLGCAYTGESYSCHAS